jgi:hypothetical protein
MAEPRFRHALVVGGTGMLAPATRRLAGRAGRLTLASRHPGTLAAEIGAAPLPIDWNDRAAASAALAAFRRDAAPVDLLVAWLHDAAVWLAAPAEACLAAGARSIRVHGSRSADPAVRRARDPDPRPDVRRQTVILGWHPDPLAEDGRRWLDHAEISDGVIAAVDEPDREIVLVGAAAGP